MFGIGQKATRQRFILLLCAALLLATPLLEAGHQHGDGLAPPDCVQCQFDSGHALAGSIAKQVPPQSSVQATAAGADEILPRDLFAPAIRGPPSIAS